MRAIEIAIVSLLAGPLAAATPHHKHRHVHKRVPDVTQVVSGPEETVFTYELNGQSINIADVCKGIQVGDLKWADGMGPAGVCASSSAAATQTPPPASTPPPAPSPSSSASSSSSSAAPAQFYESSSSSPPPSSTEAAPSPSASPSSSSSSSSSSSGSEDSGSGYSGGGGDVSKEFPDNEHDCSYFPEEYGIMKLDYLGMGGWASIQHPQDVGDAFDNIQDGTSGNIQDGMYLAYACPKGTLQRQWPSKQGATGQSVGGILCQNGKLVKTNPDYNVLCSPGVGNVQVQNKAGGSLAVCRTVYPGSESENIPLNVDVGATEPLACPDASKFYKWKGQSTSAQYYLNSPGTSIEDGCRWGDPSKSVGNYAPLNFGVGKKDGTFWISIMKNEPTTDACFPGTVELQGPDMVGSCKMENCQFSGSGATGNGCTVSSQSGDVTYVVS